MRLFLVILILTSASAQGQWLFSGKDSAWVSMTGVLPKSEPFDTSRQWKRVDQPYVYIMSEHDLYDLFGSGLSDLHRDFDFARYHILGKRECRYCLLCRHEEGSKECHRNACSYGWVWRVRDNKKAFSEIPIAVAPGHVDALIPHGWKSYLRDTVMPCRSDSSLTAWYTGAGGDCHARFTYQLIRDQYYPVILLKELNYYGGCRAGGYWDYTISFTRPAGSWSFIKVTVLMGRYNREKIDQ